MSKPKEKRIESVKRHTKWQKSLDKDKFFHEIFDNTRSTKENAKPKNSFSKINLPNSTWSEDDIEKFEKTRKDLNGKMKREFNVIIERDSEGYYVGYVPTLRGCHTQAKSLDVLMNRIREAIELCLEVEGEQEELNFIGVQRVVVES